MLTIDEELVKRYKAEGLSIEYLGTIILILHLLHKNDLKMLDIIDDSNKENSLMMLYQYMHRKKLLQTTDGSSPCLYQVTDRGMNLMKYVDKAKDGSNSEPVKKPTRSIGNVEEWIGEYFELFPKGKINNRYLRTNIPDCLERMKSFVIIYNYDKKTILEATKAYLTDKEMGPDGHKYTRNSGYFIIKGRFHEKNSDLATWCEIIKNGEVKNKEYIERDCN